MIPILFLKRRTLLDHYPSLLWVFGPCQPYSWTELEAELEAQLGQSEHRMRDLHSENHRLKNELESIKVGIRKEV